MFAGPTATILNTADLVTSNQGRIRHGLPLLAGHDGRPLRHDVLRAQRLAAPVTVYVDAYSAHPLEADAAHLYAEPDGWVDDAGTFHAQRPSETARPVYAVELRPEDGLYLLPYLARQADGSAWDATTAHAFAPAGRARQTFYPDASRLYEEIDRFGLDDFGLRVELFGVADFEFFRAAPPGGYLAGIDGGPAEQSGVDFFGYYPSHLAREPALRALADITNRVQAVLAGGDYAGAQWLEGSPTIEETLYWLNLLIDTTVPLVGHTAQRRNHTLSADGARNIVDGVKYVLSGASLDDEGVDRVGAVVIVDELAYAAREVTKVDARPGGYDVIGGHGGIVAELGGYGSVRATFVPTRRHTSTSELRLPELPDRVDGVRSQGTAIAQFAVRTKDAGGLRPEAIPAVTVHKYVRFGHEATGPDGTIDVAAEVELLARLERNLRHAPLAGFVIEGMSPFGSAAPSTDAALARCAFSGYPVVRVGRGNTAGSAWPNDPIFVVGSNLSATKARILLMAALLKFGALPVATDPARPTGDERRCTVEAVARYQRIFDTH